MGGSLRTPDYQRFEAVRAGRDVLQDHSIVGKTSSLDELEQLFARG